MTHSELLATCTTGWVFTSESVRGIAAGTKTQTRRLVHLPKWMVAKGGDLERAWADKLLGVTPGLHIPCSEDGTQQRLRNPLDFPGDGPIRVYVKEAWARRLDEDDKPLAELAANPWAWYWADAQTCNTGCAGAAGKKRSALFMPRWAARYVLEVTNVRAQRLRDISPADILAEGIADRFDGQQGIKQHFFDAWDSINGKRCSAARNPWVFAYAFRRVSA